MRHQYITVVVFVLILTAVKLDASTRESACNGNWYSRATWSGGAIPVAGDTIIISHYISYEFDLVLTNNYLKVLQGGSLCGTQKFNVERGSKVDIYGYLSFTYLTTSGDITIYGQVHFGSGMINAPVKLYGSMSVGGVSTCLVPEPKCPVEPRDSLHLGQSSRVKVTLIKASASLVSDVYVVKPAQMLLISNNLLNIGTIIDTVYQAGTNLSFGILVHGPRGDYMHASSSKYAVNTPISDTSWEIGFEDLPDSLADWDFNDAVIKVEIFKAPTVDNIYSARKLQKNSNTTAFVSHGRVIINDQSNIRQASIYDMNGHCVVRQGVCTSGRAVFDVNGFAAGAYVVKLATDSGPRMVRFNYR